MSATTERFIHALHRLEEDGGCDELVAVFHEDAELDNPMDRPTYRGRHAIEGFWKSYRRTLGRVHSEFRHITETDGVAMLEWSTRGVAPSNRDLGYSGVTVLEVTDGAVRRMRAYFDPAELRRQIHRSIERRPPADVD